jgi:hypothetical protein
MSRHTQHNASPGIVLRLAICLFLALPALALAGQVRGKVVTADGSPLPGATVRLANHVTGYSQQVTSGADGAFLLYNVPDNPYHLTAELSGFAPAHVDLTVRGAVPVTRTLTLSPSFSESVSVQGEKEPVALETDSSTSHVDIDRSLIGRFPAAAASRAFESIVLSAPGFSQDENGRYHFQGGHSQQLLVIDGQPIGDQVGITFSSSLDPAIVQDLEIETGGVSAEYGEKAYAVINLTTRSALGHDGFHGDAGIGGGSFQGRQASANLGEGAARHGLFASVDGSSSDRFLDPVSFGNLHNHGDTARAFLRYDLLPGSGSDSVRLTANAGRTHRDVTNLPSQEAAGQDQRVHSKDWNVNLGYQHVAGDWVVEGLAYARDNELRLFGSPGDTPVTADQNRALDNRGFNLTLSRQMGAQELEAGVQAKTFPIDEHFDFGITDPAFNEPASEGYNPNLAPYDLTRGGGLFTFSGSRTGNYGAAFLEDTVRLRALTLRAGLRYGRNHLFTTESELQPRLGVAYSIPPTHTVLRASYDRMFVTPEYENILLSSSEQAAALVPPDIQASNRLGFGQLYNVSEKQDVINVGVQQGIGSALRLDASYWHRRVTNSADQSQFFNTGIVFPLNFKGAQLHGWNLRLDGGPVHGVRGYLSLGHVRAIYDPPFVGGLFLDAEALDSLTGGPFVIDHDQDLQEQLGLYWDIPGTGFWLGLTQRYDSGLVTDAGTPADVLASPDTAYAAPYIRFDEDPQRVKPRTVWNASVGARLQRYHLPLEVELDVLNLTDEKGLYNFQSVFGGTHVIPPRAIAARLKAKF